MMNRKDSIKTMVLGALSLPPLLKAGSVPEAAAGEPRPANREPMRSSWSEWPDMPWVGPAYWGNRLQDWRIAAGKVECVYSGPNRNLQCLTHQLDDGFQDFTASVDVEVLNQTRSGDDYVGFRLGAKAKDTPCPVTFVDYRRAAIYGEGLDAGLTADGRLFIGQKKGPATSGLPAAVRLEVTGAAGSRSYTLRLTAFDAATGRPLGNLTVADIAPEELVGNVGLVSHFVGADPNGSETPSARFADWRMAGPKVAAHADQTYGPILFAQYTLNRNVVKFTVQLAPVETVRGLQARLQLREGGRWVTRQTASVHPLSRTVHFRVEDWTHTDEIPYRVALELPLRDRTETFAYEGTIAAEPVAAAKVKAAVFSCNQHHGFPDEEVVQHVAKHRPQMAMFLGDQIYESFGGFGVDRSHNLEKSTLDYLRKWYMFGWSYREVFRHIPSVCLLDDHCMFHGNIWGQGGKRADTAQFGFGSAAFDTGGFIMLAEWVRMVERCQASHLPDGFDPTPVEQGIGVYYGDWTYGGISFALLEDRKFKTAPKNALPPEADVLNGFIRNRDFDITKHDDAPADLLGERQHRFLEHWVADWSGGAQLKVVLSQSPFCCVHTLRQGDTSDNIVPRRPIPERGEYPAGDFPALDMDSNGWPRKGRDAALRIIRKASALHVAGDQHLASMVRYGVEDFEDAGYVYTLPALNNTWPRRWWPTVDRSHRPLPGRPKFTGRFRDAFDNRITVVSAANPVQTNRTPAIIYDRGTGYGMLVFDKENRSVRIECWPRYVDPVSNPEGQYDGWPLVLEQGDNDGRLPTGYLPELITAGLADPVVQVFDQATGELVYALRTKGSSFRPPVFGSGTYRVRIGDPDLQRWQEHENLRPDGAPRAIKCDFA